MFVKLVVDWVNFGVPTENGLFNDRDEVYFIAQESAFLPCPLSETPFTPSKRYTRSWLY